MAAQPDGGAAERNDDALGLIAMRPQSDGCICDYTGIVAFMTYTVVVLLLGVLIGGGVACRMAALMRREGGDTRVRPPARAHEQMADPLLGEPDEEPQQPQQPQAPLVGDDNGPAEHGPEI